jgi:hypothetical protein
LVTAKIVPAIGEVCRRQALHETDRGLTPCQAIATRRMATIMGRLINAQGMFLRPPRVRNFMKEMMMKQPHTEGAVKLGIGEQNTGKHKKPDAPEKFKDRSGGTRTGVENVEKRKG